MANVILFHHACGLTTGLLAFAERIRAEGHTVTCPDLYDGDTYDTIDAGVARAEEIGFGVVAERGVAAALEVIAPQATEPNPGPTVALGFSLGVLPAQKLAQTVPDVAAVILYHGGVPASVFGDQWPASVALQLHLSPEDDWAEPDVVSALAAEVPGAELFWYPGPEHLITDSSRPEYDAEATDVILGRTFELLRRCDG